MPEGLDPELARLAESYRRPVDPYAGNTQHVTATAQRTADQLTAEAVAVLSKSSAPRMALFEFRAFGRTPMVAQGWRVGDLILAGDLTLREWSASAQAGSAWRADEDRAERRFARTHPGMGTMRAGRVLRVTPPRAGDDYVGGILKADLEGEPHICFDTWNMKWRPLRDFFNDEIARVLRG